MFKVAFHLLRETVKEWNEDGATHIAAALAYYAIFSLSPLLIIVALVLGLVMDQPTVETSLVSNIQSTLGQQTAELIRSLLQRQASASDFVSTVIWISVMVWGASGMFTQLQTALNKIWEVKPKPGRSPLVILKVRLQAFAVVGVAAIALLGSMVVNTALSVRLTPATVETQSAESAPEQVQVETPNDLPSPAIVLLIRAAQFIISALVMTFLITVVFQMLPDVDIAWRDVIVGSGVTALLLLVGQFAVGVYLSRTDVGSVFGAAGSLTVILVWIYYSAQILLFGAEFTEVWARYHGAHIRPDADAVWENEEKARIEAARAPKPVAAGKP